MRCRFSRFANCSIQVLLGGSAENTAPDTKTSKKHARQLKLIQPDKENLSPIVKSKAKGTKVVKIMVDDYPIVSDYYFRTILF